MQQYSIHLEKTTIVTFKKIHCNVFLPIDICVLVAMNY
jgi:hypothetical protein